MSVYYSDYTTYELAELIDKEPPLVIVPVGATEQHGPHLPLNTDTDIGMQLAVRMAQASPVKTLVLPSVWSGFSPHHMDFSGTITLRQSTLFHVVIDIVECLIRHGITNIMLLNSHGGNVSLLKTAIDEIGVRHSVFPICVTYWHLIADAIDRIRQSDKGGMGHACELETSLKLLFSPEDVRQTEMEDVLVPGNEFFDVEMFSSNKVAMYRPFLEWTKRGQIGSPTKASKETGEKIVQAVVDQFAKLVNAYWLGHSSRKGAGQ